MAQTKLNKVTVFGSTGAQGSPVARQLIEAGVAVKAVSRHADKVRELYGGDAEPVEADLSDVNALRPAFAGVDAAFFHLPNMGRDAREVPALVDNVLAAAKEAELPRMVFTTGGTTTDIMPPIAFVEENRAIARAILTSGIPAIVLRPTIYLENLLAFSLHEIQAGKLSYPPLSPNRKVSWTGLEDQARLAIAAMTAENAIGRTFDIASPEPVTGDELAALLTEAGEREVRYEPLDTKTFGARMAQYAGEQAGKGIAELYAATDKLPADGAVINLEPVLSVLPVELTPVSKWIAAQNWN